MKWKIYFLLFGSVLSLGIFTTFTKTAHAIESYKISPEDDRTFKRDYYQNLGISEDKNIDLHYYFYAENKYSENLKLISFVCEDRNNNFEKISDCGLYMVQEAGKFKIKLKASYYSFSDYSRRTQKVSNSYVYRIYYESISIASFTDQDFERGLTLLGGTTLKVNNWNRNEGGFLLDPVGGNSNNSSNNSNSNNNSGGFDILGGIKAFFQPMIDSIIKTQKAVLSISDNILNGIKNLFSGFIDLVKNIWDFLSNFFVKLFEELGKFVKWVFIPADNNLNEELGNIRSMFSFEQITRVLNTTYLPLDSAGFSYGSECSDAYWDATTKHMSAFLDSGSQKYTKGFRLITSICKVPKIYIGLARNLLLFAFFWWAVYRVLQIIPVLMGSAYVWDRWSRKEG